MSFKSKEKAIVKVATFKGPPPIPKNMDIIPRKKPTPKIIPALSDL